MRRRGVRRRRRQPRRASCCCTPASSARRARPTRCAASSSSASTRRRAGGSCSAMGHLRSAVAPLPHDGSDGRGDAGGRPRLRRLGAAARPPPLPSDPRLPRRLPRRHRAHAGGQPLVAAIAFSTLCAYAGVTLALTQWRTRYWRAMVEAEREAKGLAVEALMNVETVKLFAAEEYEVAKYYAAQFGAIRRLWRNPAQRVMLHQDGVCSPLQVRPVAPRLPTEAGGERAHAGDAQPRAAGDGLPRAAVRDARRRAPRRRRRDVRRARL